MVFSRTTDPIERSQEFGGIRQLNNFPNYPDFADLHLRNRLRTEVDGDTTVENRILTNLVEYAILNWLATPEVTVGWDDLGTIHMLQQSVGGGGWPPTHRTVRVTPNANEINELIAKRTVSLQLPPGSTLLRKGDNERIIEIRTPHSFVRIALVRRGGSPFQSTTNPATPAIQKSLRLKSTSPGWILAFTVDIETRQVPVRRFSKQAKLEALWLARVHSLFETDFSWDRLRRRLQDAAEKEG
jgi:hypothetical protein